MTTLALASIALLWSTAGLLLLFRFDRKRQRAHGLAPRALQPWLRGLLWLGTLAPATLFVAAGDAAAGVSWFAALSLVGLVIVLLAPA
jgi:hypothetical protein